jgi:hypothetical protein
MFLKTARQLPPECSSKMGFGVAKNVTREARRAAWRWSGWRREITAMFSAQHDGTHDALAYRVSPFN